MIRDRFNVFRGSCSPRGNALPIILDSGFWYGCSVCHILVGGGGKEI
jgi:hypothetical protein